VDRHYKRRPAFHWPVIKTEIEDVITASDVDYLTAREFDSQLAELAKGFELYQRLGEYLRNWIIKEGILRTLRNAKIRSLDSAPRFAGVAAPEQKVTA
jgi:hypothetical protein